MGAAALKSTYVAVVVVVVVVVCYHAIGIVIIKSIQQFCEHPSQLVNSKCKTHMSTRQSYL